jgi:4-amino-4-deoxy-L-arabinose transferase-like glycosyltransferase
MGVPKGQEEGSGWTGGMAVVIYLALATIVVHVLTGGRYGFHRDELATLEDARHLAWGYVAYPPVTPFFGRLSLELFGTSLRGFRFFAAVAQAAALVLTGLMARELGGGRWAQVVAALAATPFCLGGGALMQYVSFDYLAWVSVAYCTLRLLKSDNPRWWIAIGGAIGFGMMSKYAMPFLVAGLGLGVLLTDARRYLKSQWLWLGAGVAVLVFLPNLIWQAQHHFVSLDFLRHIHTRDVGEGRAKGFIPGQLKLMLAGLPLFVAGLYYFFSGAGKRYRVLGWMYVTPLLLFIIMKGRDYYLAGAYPMVFAAGAVWLERWMVSLRRPWAGFLRTYIAVSLLAGIVLVSAVFLPIAPENSAWFKTAIAVNGDLREEIGWPELVRTVAEIRDRLPHGDQDVLGIIGANYGEAGAINLYGPNYGLPRAISGINSFWYRGYGDPPPQVVIVVGLTRESVDRKFASCELAAHTWNHLGIENEETADHPDIFVCRGLRQSWPEFWEDFRYYG